MSGPTRSDDSASDRSGTKPSDITTVRARPESEAPDLRNTGSWASDATTNPLPSAAPKIGHFEVRRVLGAGTFGLVHLAFDTTLQREVAIKVPKDTSLTDEEKASFIKEARAVAAIHHPNVCPVYEANTHDGMPYIVMRFVPSTLERLLARPQWVMPTRAAVTIAWKLAKGIVAAHAAGVIHRDLKPANVLYDEANKEVLIADFGLARVIDRAVAVAASTGAGKGTPLYMPPEQWSPTHWGPVGEHSDVYSLGVIFYEMLTGKTPFTGAPMEVMIHHCQTIPKAPSLVRPNLDPALDALCLKALAKRSADRYPNARAFAVALTNYLNRPTTQSGMVNVVLVEPGSSAKSGATGLEGLAPPVPPEEVILTPVEASEPPPSERKSRRPLAEPAPEPELVIDAPESRELPDPPSRSRRRPVARARPVAPKSRVWLWLLGFGFLVVAGFVLMLFLDRLAR